jgi:hypothetical protein
MHSCLGAHGDSRGRPQSPVPYLGARGAGAGRSALRTSAGSAEDTPAGRRRQRMLRPPVDPGQNAALQIGLVFLDAYIFARMGGIPLV